MTTSAILKRSMIWSGPAFLAGPGFAKSLALLCFGLLLLSCQRRVDRGPEGGSPSTGPRRGWLLAAGGGDVRGEILNHFIELAGGPDARILVIPTAGPEAEYDSNWAGLQQFRDAGAKNLAVLHTRDRKRADSALFSRSLETANGVWLDGGRQWRLVDSYLGTRTLRRIRALLARGGVVGGTSAGATIQASYLVRGAPQGNHIMMAPKYEKGFGFLRNSAIDQHLFTRRRELDLVEVIQAHPRLLGIGIDEGTAILVQGDRLEVLGGSRVAIYHRDLISETPPYLLLDRGDIYNLRRRRRE